MSELNLQRMKIELIRGGVAPKFVKRTLAELDSHYRDLKSQAIADGFSATQAREKANADIGDEKILMREILHKPELKSWLWRYPKSIFVLSPVLILILSLITSGAIIFIVDYFLADFSGMSPGTEFPLWVKVLVEILSIFNFYLLTPILAVGMILIAKQRMIQLHWPIIGIVLLMFIGSGGSYELNWPTPLEQGNLIVNWGYSFMPRAFRGYHDLQNYLSMLSTIVLCTIAWRTYRPFKTSEARS
ncbi:MAG: hypothetical protein HQ498_07070 [Pseudohongiella sp.]|nr:hypothetical protein [Pseudohongiella sp.]